MWAKIERFGNLVGAYVSLFGAMSFAAAWLLKLTKPFQQTGWGWPEAILIGVAFALIVSLVVSAALVAWRMFKPARSPAPLEPQVPGQAALTDRVVQLDHEMEEERRLHLQHYEEHTARLEHIGALEAELREAVRILSWQQQKHIELADKTAVETAQNTEQVQIVPIMARISYLERRQELLAKHRKNVDGAFVRWKALIDDPNIVPRSTDWLRLVEAEQSWRVAVDDLTVLITRVRGGEQKFIRATPNYDENPMRSVVGDESIDNDEKRQDFRRISEMRASSEREIDQFANELTGEIRTLLNRLDHLVEASPPIAPPPHR